MRKLKLTEVNKIFGGDWKDRWYKQDFKCSQGSQRACRRAARILARHQ